MVCLAIQHYTNVITNLLHSNWVAILELKKGFFSFKILKIIKALV
jgi:hypothetical protein